jgi:nucleotide-binding universal stress UspA family protein
MNILVPTDFSAPSAHALGYAETLASALGGTLHVVHIIQDIEYTEEWGNVYTKIKEIRDLVEERSREKLQQIEQELRAGNIPFVSAFGYGRPDVALANYASERDINLIVIGVSGKAGVEHFVLGSTTERLLRKASCPVLAVRPKKTDA